MNCDKCEGELPDGAKFCPNCGAHVGKVAKEEYSVSADNLVGKVKELIREGNVTRIIIRNEEGKNLIEIPATVGVVGVIFAPWLAAWLTERDPAGPACQRRRACLHRAPARPTRHAGN